MTLRAGKTFAVREKRCFLKQARGLMALSGFSAIVLLLPVVNPSPPEGFPENFGSHPDDAFISVK